MRTPNYSIRLVSAQLKSPILLPVVVQDLGKNPRMPIEEVLVQDGIIIGQRFSKS